MISVQFRDQGKLQILESGGDKADLDPTEILYEFAAENIDWSVDYSKANLDELKAWQHADLIARVARAIANFVPIFFENNVYMATCDEEIEDVSEAIEVAMSAHEQEIFVVNEDETGLKLVVHNKKTFH